MISSLGFAKIDSTTISFGVAPRINACGRMGCQEEALKLFLSKDIKEVNELIDKLNDHNKNRQEIERRIYNEAIEQIEINNLNKNRTIVVGGENWHHGVIGIVASKITEMYFKPTILLCFEEDDVGKGSGRSIPGFDLYETLSKCSDKLLKFGGHSMAIGVNISREKLEEFKIEFEKIAEEQKIEEIIPIINIDEVINMNEIDIDMVKSLSMLEPFGEKNKTPLFACKNLKIDSIRALSEGKHLKLTLRDNNNVISAIGFNMGELSGEYLIGDKVDIVGVLEINSFNGVDSIQINMKDMMRSI
ncbi:Single-stranded-DNA-specific exonuclease RecJ [compost metagenome]